MREFKNLEGDPNCPMVDCVFHGGEGRGCCKNWKDEPNYSTNKESCFELPNEKKEFVQVQSKRMPLSEPVFISFEVKDEKRNLILFFKGTFDQFEGVLLAERNEGDEKIMPESRSEQRLIAKDLKLEYTMGVDIAKNETTHGQDISRLANFLIANFPDKRESFEGAVDLAIRLLKKYGEDRINVK